jgi:hypothetical protein
MEKGGGNVGEEGFGVLEDIEVIGVGPVPLQHGVFWIMQCAAFALAEAGAYLEDFSIAGGQQAFHMKFGGRAKEGGTRRFGIDMEFERGCWEAYGGFDLGEVSGGEPVSNDREDMTSKFKSRF